MTKAIELKASFVQAKAIEGVANITAKRREESERFVQEWVERENKWRSRLSFIRCRLVSETDFNPGKLSTPDAIYYHNVSKSLFADDFATLLRLKKAAGLSISNGDGKIWLTAKEAETLQDWKNEEAIAQ